MTKSIFETIVVDPKFAEPAIEYAHSDEYKAKRRIQEKEWENLPLAKEASKDDIAKIMAFYTNKVAS